LFYDVDIQHNQILEGVLCVKLTEFKTPTGQSGNILDPSSWWGLILGTVVLLATFTMGQKLGNAIGAKLPVVNTHPSQVFSPMAAPAASNPNTYWGAA
jgi:hypothetical protein